MTKDAPITLIIKEITRVFESYDQVLETKTNIFLIILQNQRGGLRNMKLSPNEAEY